MKERSRDELTTPHARGTVHRFTLTRAEDGVVHEDVVRCAHLTVHDTPIAHVYGRAPSIDEPTLDAAFGALVESVQGTDGARP